MVLRSFILDLSRARVSLSPSRSLNRSLSSASSLLASKDDNSSNSGQKTDKTHKESQSNPEKKSPIPDKSKSVVEADAELRERLEKMSGEGGAAGIEYEDGKPVAMKRGVRNNMFRLI